MWTWEDLQAISMGRPGLVLVEEISPEEVLKELEGWPEAQRDCRAIFERHDVEVS